MKKTKQILLMGALTMLLVGQLRADWTLTNGVGTRHGHTVYTVGGTLYAGTDSGAYRSTDNGASWTRINNGFQTTNRKIYDFAYGNGKLWCATDGSGPYYSTNNGDVWIREYSYSMYSTWSIEANDQYVYAGKGSNMHYSTNLGANWVNTNGYSGYGGLIFNGNNVYGLHHNGGIFKSILGSTSWTRITGNLSTDIKVYDLKLKVNTIYIATEAGAWSSTNEGANWTNINVFNYSSVFSSIEVLNNHIIASTRNNVNPLLNKVYITADNGSNWDNITGSLPITNDNYIQEIAYNSNYIFVILYNTGFVYRRPLSEIIIGITPISSIVPDKHSLSQNYPNPFNPTTNINFDIQKAGHVKIVVYDINGKEISTLVNEELKKGSYKADIDGSDLSSGIYYYTMTSEDFVETKKMMLIK